MSQDEAGAEPISPEDYRHLRVERRGIAAYVTLARPEVHNAFNARLIAELYAAFRMLTDADDVRAVVLRGDGPSFSAGADLNWMHASLDFTHDENVSDALRMADMFRAIDSCRHPVIGRIHGAALGGGSGLTAVCDIAIAAEGTRFGFTEARMGIAPAVISPFVLRKIGVSHARALFVTGERFDAARALTIGLVHRVVPPAELDGAVEAAVRSIGQCGPAGVRAAKLMAQTVPHLTDNEAREMTAATIAGLRTSPEGQEGIRAFLEKRRAQWVSDDV
jgi:methylglutaconyl-CoA hydratase